MNIDNSFICRDDGFCIKFANGFSVSVITGPFSHSNGGISTAEVAVFNPNGDFHRLHGQNDDVIGYQAADNVVDIMNMVAGFSAKVDA